MFACLRVHSNKVQRLPVISQQGSLATNELSTKGSHLATKQSFLVTSNLMRQWIKERGIISICDSIWVGANSIKLSRCGGELGGGELAMGRNWQLPNKYVAENCCSLGCQRVAGLTPLHEFHSSFV